LKKLLEQLLEWFMLSEREIYLTNNQQDKGNGFYDRKLATPLSQPRFINAVHQKVAIALLSQSILMK